MADTEFNERGEGGGGGGGGLEEAKDSKGEGAVGSAARKFWRYKYIMHEKCAWIT